MLGFFVWNLDRVLVHVGPLTIYYYGIIFALTLLLAFVVWRRQILRGGYTNAQADGFFLWGTIAVLVGARLGHCLFYDPEFYLPDPQQILRIWDGGLSSHGAFLALLLVLFIYARVNRIRPLEIMDRFTMSAAIGAAGIRLANFVNSEIVGRVTDVPWAVRFMRYSDHGEFPRHPSQLYEFALGILVLIVLILTDRKAGKEKRPLGLLTGVFMLVYFGGRFFVEFFKEYQTTWEDQTWFTMGQMLSFVPCLAGAALLIWVWRKKIPTDSLRPVPATESHKPVNTSHQPQATSHKGKKVGGKKTR